MSKCRIPHCKSDSKQGREGFCGWGCHDDFFSVPIYLEFEKSQKEIIKLKKEVNSFTEYYESYKKYTEVEQ